MGEIYGGISVHILCLHPLYLPVFMFRMCLWREQFACARGLSHPCRAGLLCEARKSDQSAHPYFAFCPDHCDKTVTKQQVRSVPILQPKPETRRGATVKLWAHPSQKSMYTHAFKMAASFSTNLDLSTPAPHEDGRAAQPHSAPKCTRPCGPA